MSVEIVPVSRGVAYEASERKKTPRVNNNTRRVEFIRPILLKPTGLLHRRRVRWSWRGCPSAGGSFRPARSTWAGWGATRAGPWHRIELLLLIYRQEGADLVMSGVLQILNLASESSHLISLFLRNVGNLGLLGVGELQRLVQSLHHLRWIHRAARAASAFTRSRSSWRRPVAWRWWRGRRGLFLVSGHRARHDARRGGRDSDRGIWFHSGIWSIAGAGRLLAFCHEPLSSETLIADGGIVDV
jgi:hypothetical protein